jgi:hypothetical protein
MSQDDIDHLRNEFARSLDRLSDKLDVFTASLAALSQKQAEQARDIIHGRCPQPGACLTVAADVKKLDERLTPLENAFREAVGERRARLAIMATISAAAGALGAVMPYLVAYFSK